MHYVLRAVDVRKVLLFILICRFNFILICKVTFVIGHSFIIRVKDCLTAKLSLNILTVSFQLQVKSPFVGVINEGVMLFKRLREQLVHDGVLRLIKLYFI